MLSSLLRLLKLLLVEDELVALDDVAVEEAAQELLLDNRVQLLNRIAVRQLGKDMAALLLGLVLILLRVILLALLGRGLLAKVHAVLLQVPLLERLRINLDDRVL